MSMVSIVTHFMEGAHNISRMTESFGGMAGIRSRCPVRMPSSSYATASQQPDRSEHHHLAPDVFAFVSF